MFEHILNESHQNKDLYHPSEAMYPYLLPMLDALKIISSSPCTFTSPKCHQIPQQKVEFCYPL